MMNDATAIPPAVAAPVHVDACGGLIHDAQIDQAAATALFDASGERHERRGRGAIGVVETSCGRIVIRHYRRGGLIARLSRDWFVWTGAEATRPFREFRTTQRLFVAGLPVPAVIAARFVRSGLGYRADLATREIAHARTLAECLNDASAAATIDWGALGTLISRFHAVGLWHADLNAHNILYGGEGHAFLIDFDRARFLAPLATKLQGNLDRLARSLRKLGHGDIVSGEAWTRFHRAYDAAIHAASAR